MEFEVKHVGGIENCFVSLPLHLIQTLESTRRGFLPQVLTLELRSATSDRHWTIAWSGATSSSPSIEVAGQFAECISLPNYSRVQVRVLSNVEKADLVTIEPKTEDDWEVLELNAELAEDEMLKQVKVVHQGMTFPLWLHGRSIITYMVVSTSPDNVVVQLTQETEVAVAPKRRKTDLSKLESTDKECYTANALLRIQDADRRFLFKSEFGGVKLTVVLTSVAYVHPETAQKYSLESLQAVTIVPRIISRESVVKAPESDGLRMKSSSTLKEANNRISNDKGAIVHLLLSDSVAKGHVMIARSLRLYLRAGLHSWVHLKECNVSLKEDLISLALSPCHFKMLERDKVAEKNGVDVPDSHRSRKPRNSPLHNSLQSNMETIDWSRHDEVVSSMLYNHPSKADEENTYQSNYREGLKRLLRTWFVSHLGAISSATGVEANSLILGNVTILQFEVTGNDIGSDRKVKALSNSTGSIEKEIKNTEVPFELLYALTISEESMHDGKADAFKLSIDESQNDKLASAELFRKLKLGDLVSFYSPKEKNSMKGFNSNVSSLSWMGTTATDVINRMLVLLSSASGMWFGAYNLPLPGHVLIYGPHGSGKTLLARAVAKSLEEHEEILAHVVFVGCAGLALDKASTVRQSISACISEALDHSPSIVILDDLDSIVSSSSDLDASQASSHVVGLTKFLTDVMDEYGEKRKSSCRIGPVGFIASVQNLESIPQELRSSGRFDFHVQLPAPAASERGAILKHEILRRSLQCSDDILLDVASKCEGYDAYDLEILVDRAVHAAVGRFLAPHSASEKHEIPYLIRDDFSQAMHEFLPVAMRDITKSAPDSGRTGWDDVGGLRDIRNAIQEMIELPSKFPSIFGQAPLRMRSNVLLYGPPGCGKTHIVGAAASACSLRFISVKGPELLNKYIGASEQAVRDIFSKAAAAAPCLLFFDEFDSIAPKRGHDNTGVTDRVVNQFLTELDGVEVLTGVFVFAATSRPDLLDAALLRPGRLDRLLFCDFPSERERLDILDVLSKKLPLADDVDLNAIARTTEGFSGADLQALLSDGQLAAVHEHLSSVEGNDRKLPVITDAILESVASKARPSISETEKQRLYDIYSQFLDSKRSSAVQSREAKGKGKRATLA